MPGSSSADDVATILEDEESLKYEEEISRNPYLLDSWTKYLAFRKGAKPRARYMIFERALKCLPRSYKLWREYLQERTAELLAMLKGITSGPATDAGAAKPTRHDHG